MSEFTLQLTFLGTLNRRKHLIQRVPRGQSVMDKPCWYYGLAISLQKSKQTQHKSATISSRVISFLNRLSRPCANVVNNKMLSQTSYMSSTSQLLLNSSV